MTRWSRPSRRGAVAAVIAVPWVLWALVRVLGLDDRHPLVAAMALTPYMAALAPIPVLAAVLLRARVPAVLALAAGVSLAASVLPRALDGPHLAPEGADGRRLVVMTANLFRGRADARAVVRLARERNVDVLSLQELTPEAVERLDDAGARDLLPRRVLEAAPGAAGSGLMARHALLAIAGAEGIGHAQPEATLRVSGQAPLRLTAVHPLPPISGPRARLWRRQLRELPGPDEGGVAHVLVGDFNGTLDNRDIRRLLDRGYHDAADATGDGLRATWPVGTSLPPITIDHVLLPAAIAVRRVAVREVPGTDHRAVIAELVLPG